MNPSGFPWYWKQQPNQTKPYTDTNYTDITSTDTFSYAGRTDTKIYSSGCIVAMRDTVAGIRESLGLVAAALLALVLSMFVLLVATCATASGTVCTDVAGWADGIRLPGCIWDRNIVIVPAGMTNIVLTRQTV